MPRSHLLLAAALALCLAACSDDGSDSSQTNNGAPDAGADVGDDVTEDIGGDADEDTANDVGGPETNAVVVSTGQGRVRGVLDDESGVLSWKGIPYAAPPVGELRWKAPAAPSDYDELDGSAFGPVCPQPSPAADGDPDQREDCLTVNIWAPEGAVTGSLPVMVWIHGGSFTSGSGSLPFYDGTALASQGVVVVTINYRLGALGFMAHEALIDESADYPSAGNYGLLDQLAALAWTRDNIRGFGGATSEVTVFGESAGAISICSLLASPLSEGLFHRAVMQSGFCSLAVPALMDSTDDNEATTVQGARIAEQLGCGDAEDVGACLREASVDELRSATNRPFGQSESFTASVDGYVLTQAPGAAQLAGDTLDVPLLIGANGDEGTIFIPAAQVGSEAAYRGAVNSTFGAEIGALVLEQYPVENYSSPYRALADVFGDFVFVCPTRAAAGRHAMDGNDTWLYHFTHVTNFGEMRDLGAFHGSEIGFVFGTTGAFTLPTPNELRLSAKMQALWVRFASGEAPTAEEVVWEPHDPAANNGLELAIEPKMITDWHGEQCDFWAELLAQQ